MLHFDGFLVGRRQLIAGADVRPAAGPFAEQLAILDRLDACASWSKS